MLGRAGKYSIPLLFLLLLIGAVSRRAGGEEVVLHYFWGTGCPVCEEAKPFLAELKRNHPYLEIRSYDVMASRENLELWIETAERTGGYPGGIPAFYIGKEAFSGFSPAIARRIEALVMAESAGIVASPPAGETLRLPLIGDVEPEHVSLPLFTVLIALIDSFNPCAFFVLLFLLSLLVHVRSRRRMLLVGGTFVLCSGLVYFLFMAAWLNIFLLVGHLRAITMTAGGVALVIGLINTKDFFLFHKGISLSIPETAKPRLFARMRNLLKAQSSATMLAGAIVLALAANSYELLCTAGFPMVFTRVLTLQPLSTAGYFLYLAFYNLVYIIPLAIIVGIGTATLGKHKMSEKQGRLLKLLSGTMMILLGGSLLVQPTLLSSPLWAAGLMAVALVLTAAAAMLEKRVGIDREKK